MDPMGKGVPLLGVPGITLDLLLPKVSASSLRLIAFITTVEPEKKMPAWMFHWLGSMGY